MHLLSAYRADGEVENARLSRLERKIYTGRRSRSGEGIGQSVVSDDRILGRGYNALRSQRLDQAIADVQLDFAVVDRRLSKLDSLIDGDPVRSIRSYFTSMVPSVVRRSTLASGPRPNRPDKSRKIIRVKIAQAAFSNRHHFR
jgi:hypothetical protein